MTAAVAKQPDYMCCKPASGEAFRVLMDPQSLVRTGKPLQDVGGRQGAEWGRGESEKGGCVWNGALTGKRAD